MMDTFQIDAYRELKEKEYEKLLQNAGTQQV